MIRATEKVSSYSKRFIGSSIIDVTVTGIEDFVTAVTRNPVSAVSGLDWIILQSRPHTNPFLIVIFVLIY
jgi:hypothetical protein